MELTEWNFTIFLQNWMFYPFQNTNNTPLGKAWMIVSDFSKARNEHDERAATDLVPKISFWQSGMPSQNSKMLLTWQKSQKLSHPWQKMKLVESILDQPSSHQAKYQFDSQGCHHKIIKCCRLGKKNHSLSCTTNFTIFYETRCFSNAPISKCE